MGPGPMRMGHHEPGSVSDISHDLTSGPGGIAIPKQELGEICIHGEICHVLSMGVGRTHEMQERSPAIDLD